MLQTSGIINDITPRKGHKAQEVQVEETASSETADGHFYLPQGFLQVYMD